MGAFYGEKENQYEKNQESYRTLLQHLTVKQRY